MLLMVCTRHHTLSLLPLSLLRLVVSTSRDSLSQLISQRTWWLVSLSLYPVGWYYGWARVDEGPTQQMVMSIGWNPQYMNDKKSMVCSPVL